MRVGAQCVTGSTRPLGRPRIAGVTEKGVKRTELGKLLPRTLSASSTSPLSPLTTTEDDLQSGSTSSWNPLCLGPPTRLLNTSNMTGLDVEELAPSSVFETNADLALGVQLPPYDVEFDFDSIMEPAEWYEDDPNRPTAHRSRSQREISESSEPTDMVAALSKLNEDVARQISQIDVQFCGPANPIQRCLDQLHNIKGNPVEEMLQNTSRLVNIIESLTSSPSTSNEPIHISPKHPPSISDPGSPNSNSEPRETYGSAKSKALTMPAVLMVLSSYILLLGLYDAVFVRVRNAMAQLDDLRSFFQDTPEIRVDGLSSMKLHLYAKIIIQVVENHFGRLESLLGLPVEFSLSGQPPRSHGLLETVELSRLLHVSMTQTTGNSGISGKSALQSFRDNLRALQAMLPG